MPRAWPSLLAALWSAACHTAAPAPPPSAAALLARGRMFEAEAALRASPHDPLDYGELVLGRDNLPEAAALARAALRVDPGSQRAQLLLARAQERRGDIDAAARVFEKWRDAVWLCRAAIDAARNSAACLALRGQPDFEAVSAYAAWLLRGAQPDRAEAVLRQALERTSEASPQVRVISRLRYQLALALRDQHRPLEAEVEFWHALALQRDVLAGSLYIGDTLYALGAMKMAQGWSASFQPFLKEALEIRARLLDPADWRVAQARGAVAACLAAQHRFADAGADLRDVFEQVQRARGNSAPETVELRGWLQAPK